MIGRVKRCVLIAVAALVVAGGVLLDPGAAEAAKKKKKKNSSSGVGALTVRGTTNKQYSCEGELQVFITYVRDGVSQTVAVPLERKGGWSTSISSLLTGRYTVDAKVVGHPRQIGPSWPQASIKVKKNKLAKFEFEQVGLDRC